MSPTQRRSKDKPPKAESDTLRQLQKIAREQTTNPQAPPVDDIDSSARQIDRRIDGLAGLVLQLCDQFHFKPGDITDELLKRCTLDRARIAVPVARPDRAGQDKP